MWFGDLVTMKWWNGIWLNEAFATFMEMLAVDAFKPEWERWVSFGVGRGAAMAIDGLRSTRPIEFTVRRPEECEGMFDILTYEKGAAVLRMLEQYLGRRGVPRGHRALPEAARVRQRRDHRPLGRHRGGHRRADPPDHGLLDLPGRLPARQRRADGDGTGLTLRQRRFRYLASDDDTSVRWNVPVMLRVKTANGVETRRLLLEDDSMTVDLGSPVEWVVANERGSGFFRARYDASAAPGAHRGRAVQPECRRAVQPRQRHLGLRCWPGPTPVPDFLASRRLFTDETDRNVWLAIIGGLELTSIWSPPPTARSSQAFIRDLVGPAVARARLGARGRGKST